MVYSNTAVNGVGGGMSMVNRLIGLLVYIFTSLKHLMTLLKYNSFLGFTFTPYQ